MSIIFGFIAIIARAVSLYSLLCIARVFFTWLPDLNYSPFGKLLARICDPWLNLFRSFNPFKNSPLDISPMIAVGALMMISSVLKQMIFRRSFSVFAILSAAISVIWSICSSILTFFNLLLAIRLVAELLGRTQSSIWYTIDRVLNPVLYKVCTFFLGNRFVRPKTAMIITLTCSIVIQLVAGTLIYRFT